jgi:hypothetical protein
MITFTGARMRDWTPNSYVSSEEESKSTKEQLGEVLKDLPAGFVCKEYKTGLSSDRFDIRSYKIQRPLFQKLYDATIGKVFSPKQQIPDPALVAYLVIDKGDANSKEKPNRTDLFTVTYDKFDEKVDKRLEIPGLQSNEISGRIVTKEDFNKQCHNITNHVEFLPLTRKGEEFVKSIKQIMPDDKYEVIGSGTRDNAKVLFVSLKPLEERHQEQGLEYITIAKTILNKNSLEVQYAFAEKFKNEDEERPWTLVSNPERVFELMDAKKYAEVV